MEPGLCTPSDPIGPTRRTRDTLRTHRVPGYEVSEARVLMTKGEGNDELKGDDGNHNQERCEKSRIASKSAAL